MNKSSLSIVNYTLWMKSRVAFQVLAAISIAVMLATGMVGCAGRIQAGATGSIYIEQPAGGLYRLDSSQAVDRAAAFNRKLSSFNPCYAGGEVLTNRGSVTGGAGTREVPVDIQGRRNGFGRRGYDQSFNDFGGRYGQGVVTVYQEGFGTNHTKVVECNVAPQVQPPAAPTNNTGEVK